MNDTKGINVIENIHPKNGEQADVSKIVDAFFQDLSIRIEKNNFQNKEELVNTIKSFGKSLEQNPTFHALSFQTEMRKALKAFDERTEKAPTLQGTEQYSQSKDAEKNKNYGTLIHNGEVVTIAGTDDIKKTLDDTYNEEEIQNLGKEAAENNLASNFETLRKHTKEEVFLEKAANVEKTWDTTDTFTENKKREVLMYYAANNHLDFLYSKDGMAIDAKTGDAYQAIISPDQTIFIKKLEKQTYNAGSPVTEQETTVDQMTNGEWGEKDKDMIEQTDAYTAIIDAAMQYKENNGYIDFLNDPTLGLSPEEIEYCKNEVEQILANEKGDDITMDTRMQKKAAPKVYQKVQVSKRNGYVNAVLLTVITLLFGVLCLTFMVTSITGA